MIDGIEAGAAHRGAVGWEYKVMKVSAGPLAYQKYGPETPGFEATLNEMGAAGWEAFHAQSYAEGEAILVFFKRLARTAGA